MKAYPKAQKNEHFNKPHKLLTESVNNTWWSPDLEVLYTSKNEGLKAIHLAYPEWPIVIREDIYTAAQGYGGKAKCEELFTIYQITD